MTVKVSFTDDAGNDETLTSAATVVVEAAAAEEEPTEPPPAPTNLTAAVNADGSVTLTWGAPDDDSVTGYLDPAAASLRGGEDAAGVRGGHWQHGDHLHRHRRHRWNAARVPGQDYQRGRSGQAVQLRQRGPVGTVRGDGGQRKMPAHMDQAAEAAATRCGLLPCGTAVGNKSRAVPAAQSRKMEPAK